MKKIVLTFGLISGTIVAAMTALMIPLCMRGVVAWEHSEIIGYTTMVLAFLLVFFGIRSYRDNVSGGTISFGKAFQVGILITLVACAVYVIAWEIVYFGFLPDFAETYTKFLIDKMREEGATAAEIAAKTKQMERFSQLYRNPLFNIAVTFMEIFPVGLVVTLVSAGILRRKGTRTPSPATATA